jgi:hypothetical protein
MRRRLRPFALRGDRVDACVGSGASNGFRHDRGRGYGDAVRDFQVPKDNCTASYHAVAADSRAAGNADAAGNRGVRADAHVVPYLDLVVELDAFFDDGTVVLAPISTSSPISTRPVCGILIQRPLSSAIPNPSLPITTPA